jgi:hypothetical protein
VLFTGLAVAATWPLARGLGRDVPSDYGDPLFVAWAMGWVAHQLGRALSGDLEALVHFWDANQLHPEPSTLALSDHFVAQALPLAPVYWLTQNALLLLGLGYLAAFVLCGFCTWLLVREVTGSAAAGVVAGCTFAFNPFFLVFELAHLQVISAWGMPLALYGLRRYFEHRARSGLCVGAAGIVLLSLSAGYYMLMFPVFVLLYVAWEVSARRRWNDGWMWLDLLAAGAGTLVVMTPFLWPYVQARRRLGFSRGLDLTAQMAATVDGYIAAVWPLCIPFACAALAVGTAAALRLGGTRRAMPLLGFSVAGAALAFWLSLGPAPVWAGEAYPALGLYRVLQDHVPGFDALRVSSRFAVVFVLCLSMLAGMGAALLARLPKVAPILVGLGTLSMLLNAPATFPMNGALASTVDVMPPAPYLTPGGTPPAVYRYLGSLPASAVVAELPFTDLWYNTRYLFFSTFHWRPILNGFTSFFPPAYLERARWLVNPVRTPDEAWRALEAGRATHVVVHTGAWNADYVHELDRWLASHGARSHGQFDGAVVYEIAPRSR